MTFSKEGNFRQKPGLCKDHVLKFAPSRTSKELYHIIQSLYLVDQAYVTFSRKVGKTKAEITIEIQGTTTIVSSIENFKGIYHIKQALDVVDQATSDFPSKFKKEQ
ncbi:hypothetical protein ACH5RR_003308 [Cinchona calisaya]|uniref:Uncharacterized protein n=1 Tax=Cinchona calisaya TaxID=153742 RepID=A0ABD3AUE8_9GENT